MVAGPCCVTDNVEGTTHNEMQAPRPPPGMETTERMNCSGQRLWGQDFPGHPATAVSSLHCGSLAAEMENSMGRRKALPSPLPCLPWGWAFAGVSCPGTWGEGEERKGLGSSDVLVSSAQSMSHNFMDADCIKVYMQTLCPTLDSTLFPFPLPPM